MSPLNELNTGSIILYINELMEKDRVAISKIDKKIPNTLLVVHYPIGLNSRIFLLGLEKEQEKEYPWDMKKPFDWIYGGKVKNNSDIEELERIAIANHNFSGEEYSNKIHILQFPPVFNPPFFHEFSQS